jgi:HSP20 family molecular chaperone IbpA
MTWRMRRNRMWEEACLLIDRAERLQRQFFEPVCGRAERVSWMPPVDMFEFGPSVWVVVALPGVGAEDFEVVLDGRVLSVAGRRRLPAELRSATIHRLELPHGRFERQVSLPDRRWKLNEVKLTDGCLTLHLVTQERPS